MTDPEDEGTILLRNVGKFTSQYGVTSHKNGIFIGIIRTQKPLDNKTILWVHDATVNSGLSPLRQNNLISN
jgi:hypothetical protein